jgi:hypothetical protein
MAEALRSAGAGVEPPSDDQRRAYVSQVGSHFPEIAHVAATVTHPRAYVPPPVTPAPATVTENEGVEVKAPPPDLPRDPAPPPIVDPSKVKY